MDINPFEVKKELENSSPFQRKEIAKNYTDLFVSDWSGKIFEVDKIEEDLVRVFLSCGEGNDHMVTVFEAKLSEYPELRVVKPKQNILIKKAKIKKIEGFYIYLYDCEIDFIKNEKTTDKNNKIEPMVKVEKGGKDFEMIDCEIDGGNRPAFGTEAENTRLIRTRLKSGGGETRKSWFSMDNPFMYILVVVVLFIIIELIKIIFKI